MLLSVDVEAEVVEGKLVEAEFSRPSRTLIDTLTSATKLTRPPSSIVQRNALTSPTREIGRAHV